MYEKCLKIEPQREPRRRNGSQKGTKRVPKGRQREPNGAKSEPKGSQRAPNVAKRRPEGAKPGKSLKIHLKREPKSIPNFEKTKLFREHVI
jgi:hypothetical protein